MNNNSTNLFRKVYHFTFCLQKNNMNPSILEEKLEFQYLRGDIHIHIATQNIILTFLLKWHFNWYCKYRNCH